MPSSESTDGAVEGDVGVAQGHVIPVDQSELQEPRDQMTPVQLDEVSSLRQALEMAEQQAQLINSEYGKLLREKEVKQFTWAYDLYVCSESVNHNYEGNSWVYSAGIHYV